MPVTTMVVTGKWLKPDNTVATGRVEFVPTVDRSVNSATLVDRATVSAVLDATGAISVTLVRLTGGYEVKEMIVGCSIKRYALPDGAGPTDLSSLTV